MLDFEPVSESILRLELSWEPFGFVKLPVSVWLVRGASSWTLIDSGPPETSDHLVAAVSRATGGAGVRQVLLTHGHYDHAGGLAALRLAWNPAILCHVDEMPFVAGEASYADVPARTYHYWLGRFFLQDLPWGQTVARGLERGQSVEGMAVIHLPGHSPGHIGFLHPLDQAMICGDTVMTLRGRLSRPFIFVTPDPHLAEASIQRLGQLDFAHLLPSHGRPILERGRQAVLDYLARRGRAD
jgi:glyoxylase-like metal-dependent hydrolase (beta-lactamase superfamily II)